MKLIIYEKFNGNQSLKDVVLSVFQSEFYQLLQDNSSVINEVNRAISGFITQAIDNVTSGKEWSKGLISASIGGAITGGFAATGANKFVQAAVSGVVAGVTDYVAQAKGGNKVNLKQVGFSVVAGAFSGLYGRDGVMHKKGDLYKAKNAYTSVINGIKNRKWNGKTGSKYLSIAAKNLGTVMKKTMNTTTRRYFAGAVGVSVAKRLWSAFTSTN